jgi:hypothetical protein
MGIIGNTGPNISLYCVSHEKLTGDDTYSLINESSHFTSLTAVSAIYLSSSFVSPPKTIVPFVFFSKFETRLKACGETRRENTPGAEGAEAE